MKKIISFLALYLCLTHVNVLNSTERLIKEFNGPLKTLSACGFFGDAIAMPNDNNGLVLRHLDSDDSVELIQGKDMVSACGASTSGNYFASGDHAGMVALYKVSESQIKYNNFLGATIQTVAFSGDDSVYATLSWDNVIAAHSISKGDRVFYKKLPEQVVSVSPGINQSKLAVGFKDRAELWTVDEFSNHTVNATLRHNGGVVHSLEFHPNGKTIATGLHNSVKIWDTVSGDAVTTLQGLHGICSPVRHSPDGTYLTVGSFDDAVAIYDMRVVRIVSFLAGHSGGVDALYWKPDGTQLISCSNRDKMVKVWEFVPPSTGEGRLVRFVRKCRQLFSSTCLFAQAE